MGHLDSEQISVNSALYVTHELTDLARASNAFPAPSVG